MDKEYILMRGKYHFDDTEHTRKRWKDFQEHRKRCKQRTAKLHELYKTNRTAWEAELSKLTPAEQRRQRRLEESKATLLSKLIR